MQTSNPKKRRMHWHGPGELQQIEEYRWRAPDEHTYVELQTFTKFAKRPSLSPESLKRRRDQAESQQTTPQQRVYYTGETKTPPLVKRPGSPNELMTDAPPMRHVNWTPPANYNPPQPFKGAQPKGILRERIAAYEALPAHLQPASPFVDDYSGYVELRDPYDDQQEEQAREAKRQRIEVHSPVALPFSPRPIKKISTNNPSNQFRVAPSRLRTSGAVRQPEVRSQSTVDYVHKLRVAAQREIERRQQEAANKALYQEAKQEVFDWKPAPPIRALPAQRQHQLFPQSDAVQERQTLRRASGITIKPKISPLRKIIRPTSQRKAPSPPRKILSPKSQQPANFARPEGTDIYPSLRANYTQALPSPAPEDSPEHGTLRRIGGRLVKGLAHYAQATYYALVKTLFGYRKVRDEVFAVETDASGRKRRAIAASDMSSSSKMQQTREAGATMPPGNFPSEGEAGEDEAREESPPASPKLPDVSELKLDSATQPTDTLETPPESRPGSSGSSRKDELLANGFIEKTEEYTMYGTKKNPLLRAKSIEEMQRLSRQSLMLPEEFRAKHTYEPGYVTPKVRPLSKKSQSVLSKNRADQDDWLETILAKAKKFSQEARAVAELRASQQKQEQPVSTTEKVISPPRDFKKEAQLQTKEEHERFRKQAVREAAQRALEEEKLRKQAERDAAQRALEEAALRQKEERESVEKAEGAARTAAIKYQLIRPLDPEWAQKVSTAMNTTNGKQVLARTPDGVELTRYDLGKILPQTDASGKSLEREMKIEGGRTGPSGWLNDEAVNAVLAMIVSRKNEQNGYIKGPKNVPEIAAFNTAWYTNWKEKGGVHGFKSWSRRMGVQGDKLLRARKIFFPVNTGAHWLIMIISPQDKIIEVLDSASTNSSLSKGGKGRWFGIARDWLRMELGNNFKEEDWTDSQVNSAQQTNFDDCGVFTCMNALAAAKGRRASEVSAFHGMQDARKMVVAVMLNGGFHGDWEL